MSRIDPAIQAALKDPYNGNARAIYQRRRITGSPFKIKDRRCRHYIGARPALEVARENGIQPRTFYQRLGYGWTVEQAVRPGRTRYDKERGEDLSVPSALD